MALANGLIEGEDGKVRCFWHDNKGDYLRYHDEEWGLPQDVVSGQSLDFDPCPFCPCWNILHPGFVDIMDINLN